MKYLPGQYVRVNEKYVGSFRTDIGIVEADPHPEWNDCVAVRWPGLKGRYKTVFPVARDAIVLV